VDETVNRGHEFSRAVRGDSTGIQSIEVGMPLLGALAKAPGPLALSALAAAAGMPRSKAHKYLVSFVRTGLVIQKSAGGAYDLGPAALELGLAAMRRLDVVQMGQETLNELRDRLETTASLAVWANRGPTIVRWAETPHVISQTVRLGTVFPLLTSTLGLIFAAYLDRRFTERLMRAELAEPGGAAARGGLRDMADVDALLADVRLQGMVAADSVVAPGIASVSAPVFDHTNKIAAAIAVAGIRGQFDLSLSSPAAHALAETCGALSRHMGAPGLP
jgi:DNA-binding IclR family transcriptional regulator